MKHYDLGMHLVENTLSLYALDIAFLPAVALYQIPDHPDLKSILDKCHIYLIGLVPIVTLLSAREVSGFIHLDFQIGTEVYRSGLKLEIPAGHKFVKDGDGGRLEDENGIDRGHTPDQLLNMVARNICPLGFNVLYVGQAYGKNGERAAIERLKEHSTLQKIALMGVPNRFRLELVLLGIEGGNQMFTEFNPRATVTDDKIADQRIKKGIDKLFNTSEAERTALYEAALIRYFQPKYNKQFKDSFPSTNLRVLDDCYEKDMQAIVAEINFDGFVYHFFSDSVDMAHSHIAYFNLHSEHERRSFFARVGN